MMRIIRIFVVLSVLLVVFATPAAARDVPLEGTVMGEHVRVEGDPACAGYAWSFSSEGTGQMTDLGAVEYSLMQCTSPGPGGIASVGTMSFIAANGDELYFEHTMVSELQFAGPGPPVGFAMGGEWEAVGGTGRFANVEGEGTLEGVGDIPDGAGNLGVDDGLMKLEFEGKITYTYDRFVDDDESIFESDIEALERAAITKGCNPPENTMFCPNAVLSRGQMAAMMVRAMGYTDVGDGDLFTDDDDSIFETDIDKLATAKVTLGCNPPANDHFCPDDPVTRGQMAAFLVRALALG
ncbi:MAG: hypothetical protein QNJ75_06825 [Acidimicrobiia bacterium]|nr:hypothetical protein [Acidimicrobiia bacterium]